MIEFLTVHWVQVSATLYAVATAAINAMAQPTDQSSVSYAYWYRFLRGLPILTTSHH